MVVWPHRRATISLFEAYHMPAPLSAASPSSKTLQRSHLAATMAVPRPVHSRTGLQQSLQVFCAVDRTTAPTPCPAPTVGTYSTYSDLQHLQHLQVYSTYSLQQTYSTPLHRSWREGGENRRCRAASPSIMQWWCAAFRAVACTAARVRRGGEEEQRANARAGAWTKAVGR